MSKKTRTPKIKMYLIALALLVIGFLIGYFSNNSKNKNNLAQTNAPTPSQIEQTKNDIANLYKGKTVTACWQVNNGPDLGVGKYVINYRYLRINKQLNRAIVTDCGENDSLLYKNKSGQWTGTNVNITINNRLNPVWQQACKIQDITIADTQVRPENNSIDDLNLQECNLINKL